MSKNTIWAVLVVIILIVVGVFVFSKQEAAAPSQPDDAAGTQLEGTPPVNDTPDTPIQTSADEVVITYTSSGYAPANVEIKAGDKVTFKNNSSVEMWPASAMHPTHTVYPGSDIKKCNTAEEKNIFDACRGIPAGGSYSFVFTQSGTWRYHDHLTTNRFGSIVVE